MRICLVLALCLAGEIYGAVDAERGVSLNPQADLPPHYSPGARARARQNREKSRMKGNTGMVLKNLEPKAVWKHFDKIRSTPHCSRNEWKLAQYIAAYARSRGLEAVEDSCGNVKVTVPASRGREHAAALAVQTHLDMVCEKNSGVSHDFESEPIELVLDNGWLSARGTTLGADNGIGVACALALIDNTALSHPRLELVFTVEEETGLVGAGKLDTGFILATRLVNLDSEDLGVVYIGCAGGSVSTITLPVAREGIAAGAGRASVVVSGLSGGHSGLDIHRALGNAIRSLARVLTDAGVASRIRLVGMRGGNKLNAIPREAEAEVALLDARVMKDLETSAAEEQTALAGSLETGANAVRIKEAALESAGGRMLDEDSHSTVLELLSALPHGVHAMSTDIPDLVETSNNLATVSLAGDTLCVGTMARSSLEGEQARLEETIRAVAAKLGASVSTGEHYPGWKPDLGSKLLALTKQSYAKVLGKPAQVKAIHAGLECGIIGERFPGIEMVSIGPTIKGAHSPGERVEIASVEKFWRVLCEIIERQE